MTESALAAIGVEWQAARPLGEGLAGEASGSLGEARRMTESALPARLKLHWRAPAPWKGVRGKPLRGGTDLQSKADLYPALTMVFLICTWL